MSLLDVIVPNTALRYRPGTNPRDPVREIHDWLASLNIVVPDPEPFALRWNGDGYDTIPATDAVEDEDVVIHPDTPDLWDLAHGARFMVADCGETFPGPLSWRRWNITGRLASLLYVSGVTRTGGGTTWAGRDPVGTPIYHLPRWSHVLPRRGQRLRPYLLWKREWWWECQRAQGWCVRRHKPGPLVFGMCGTCCRVGVLRRGRRGPQAGMRGRMVSLLCPHGMPTPAACLECMEAGPVAPPRPCDEQLLRAERWIVARHDGRCARRSCAITEGDRIGVVADVGWVCEGCAA